MDNKVIKFVIVLVLICIAVFGFMYAIDRNEVSECEQWRIDSESYAGFWLAEWQKEQCDYHGIVINAPVGQPVDE